MDGDDYTYQPSTFPDRVTAMLAEHEQKQYKLEQRVMHLETWVHRLLNPNGDMTDHGTPTLFDNPQDGL